MTKKFIFTIEVDFDDMVEFNNDVGGDATEDDYTKRDARQDMGGFLDNAPFSTWMSKVELVDEED